ncbi:MAG TPA: class I SAM-dependent methyltransferase [Deltaproteobacteria bacterium]|nr:class I SAM-dependent methyltransferase [Deltaproteobacteria bacterium]
MIQFPEITEEEIERINKLQQESFDELYYLFEPPLPEGVPERLEKIVELGKIKEGDTALDIGSGTGILIPIIMEYRPSRIYACDLSSRMLEVLKQKFPTVVTLLSDIREVKLPDRSIDVAFLNACYPNIVDKKRAFLNLSRMLKSEGRIVISYPLGKAFIKDLKKRVPYPLDEFPGGSEAKVLFNPFGLAIEDFVDEEKFYVLVLMKKHLASHTKQFEE